MNDTITLGRLAEMVASSASVDKSLAEKFIKAFFAHIEDSLVVSADVSINDLGTFTRLSNIDNPIEFIPANSLVDALNEPFEMFAPVPIGDVELDVHSNVHENIDDISENERPSETADDVISQKDEEIIEPVSEYDNPTLSAPESDAGLYSDTSIDHDNTEVIQSATDPDSKSEINQNHGRSSMWFWAIILFLIGLFLGGLAGYFGHDRIYNAFYTPSDSCGLAPVDSAVPYMPLNTVVDEVVDSILCDTINELDSTLEVERAEIYDTVTSQRFLTTMARKYYGQMEYWVFIYDANSDVLHDPNRIKPGTRVRIPDLSDFTKNEPSEKTLQRAKNMGREIYSRYQE